MASVRPDRSSIEPEDIGVWIRSTKVKVGDNLCRNDAKRDAVAAVAKRKIGLWNFWSLADVGQAIFSLTERARPCVRYLQVNSWKHGGKSTL